MDGNGDEASASSPADRYERAYPGTGIPDAQKQERQERLDFKQERQELRRTSRTRSFLIPPLPWEKED